ncbi:MAG: hypothetical protein R2792_14990 [Saprospiraceae bacterium]
MPGVAFIHAWIFKRRNPGHGRAVGDPGAEPIDGEDNVLYAFELQACKLHADLVVLGACHTGAENFTGVKECTVWPGHCCRSPGDDHEFMALAGSDGSNFSGSFLKN